MTCYPVGSAASSPNRVASHYGDWIDGPMNPYRFRKEFFCGPDSNQRLYKRRPYYSFFDVDGSGDANYQMVGNNPILVSVRESDDPTDGQAAYYHQYLTLTGF